jgi:uncharacterized protein
MSSILGLCTRFGRNGLKPPVHLRQSGNGTVHGARDTTSSHCGVQAEWYIGKVASTRQGEEREMHIVTLCCRDIAAMATFYTRLGWRDTMPAVDNYFQFETGGALLALWPMDQALAEVAAASARPREQFGGVTLAVLVPTRDDVDRRLDVARQAGASKILAAEERAWGGRSGYFFDPEGNAWEVVWNPRARFDARGALLPFA